MYRRLCAKVLPELIPARSRILVAISGGPDSVALSHVLWRYSRDEKDQEVALVLSHVNHGVRSESEKEAEMVMDLAEKWGIPCLVHRFNAKAYARKTGRSFQEAAREWRYARWLEDMEQEKCQLLATAHHLGDQAETILYRLLRGSGSAGLAGIYPKRDGVIRPLLSVTKEEIFAYCQEESLPYALDCSNYEPVYDRNRIRLELLPLLAKHYNPRILQALGRTGELMRWDAEYLASLAQSEWEKYLLQDGPEGVCLSLKVFGLDPALLSRVLRRAAAAAGGDPRGLGFIYVEQILNSEKAIGWEQNLPGITVKIAPEGLWFVQRTDREISEEIALSVEVPWNHFAAVEQIGIEVGLFVHALDILATGTEVPMAPEESGRADSVQNMRTEIGEEAWPETEEINFSPGNLQEGSFQEGIERRMVETTLGAPIEAVRTQSKRGAELYAPTILVEAFDAEAVLSLAEPLVLRTRRPGDKMWFKGVGHKSLKKVCQEEKVPAGQRKKMLVLASGEEVLWLPGVKRSDLLRPAQAGKTAYCRILRTKTQTPEIP